MPPYGDSDLQAASAPRLAEAVPPRIGDWLWRPWYAKVWWFLIVAFWLGAFVAQWISSLQPIFHDDHFPAIFLILHPFAAIPVLSLGFARKWVQFYAAVPTELDEMEDVVYSPTGLGLRHQRFSLSDPFDPIPAANPANPANPEHPLHRH